MAKTKLIVLRNFAFEVDGVNKNFKNDSARLEQEERRAIENNEKPKPIEPIELDIKPEALEDLLVAGIVKRAKVEKEKTAKVS